MYVNLLLLCNGLTAQKENTLSEDK